MGELNPNRTIFLTTAGVGIAFPLTRAAAILFLIVAITGCAQPVLRRDWSGYDGPGAAVFHRETLPPPEFPDPLEPLNRSVWAFNHALIVAVADPVGRGYRLVIPRFARDRIRDFAANLVFPRNLVANLLQGKWRAARDETARFAVNTTAGVAGLWDPATQWLRIESAPEDFGQVFARWGWRPSTFLVLPIVGPSSIRDGMGLIPDWALDPATYFFPAGPILSFNDVVDSIPEYRRFAASSFDAYDDARMLWSLAREERIEEPHTSGAGDDTGATQTLEAAFLGPRDPGFAARLDTGEVAMPTTGRALPYSYRMQPGRAPLVFLVPGLATHRLGSSSLALAEMAWERGFSIAIVSSTFSFEFIERGGRVPVPGHAPFDARDTHVALDAIARDLGARYPDRIGARVYLGYSLGAFHGFYIAAAEHGEEKGLVSFDRYLLLDPPVRLIDGMERLDAFYDVPLALPKPARDAEVRRILLKAVSVAKRAQEARLGSGSYSRIESTDLGDGTVTPEVELPFTNEEAEFLIGLAFRRSLQPLLYASQEREDLGVLLTERRRLQRLPAYEEIGDYSFEMYFYAFLLPYYRDRLGTIASAEQMIAMNDLHAIADSLRGNPKLRVFANRNDFLTSEADIEWLTALIGPERARFFPTGGHLGNLHRPEVQAEVMASLDDLAPAGGNNP
jgi:phospholipid-binding lipoprotein MlaA